MEKSACNQKLINNDFYENLGDAWYTATDHPIALLRAENRVRNSWLSSEIKERLRKPVKILDVGCGAGLTSNHLALDGHQITAVDISESSLEVARRYDQTKSVSYSYANAYALPFPSKSFDVVCAMDILEHVSAPEQLISEASRLLRKDGLFFFHTFNRNLLSHLVIVKGVEWFVKNTPKNMHVYQMFIKPEELKSYCAKKRLQVEKCVGLAPSLAHSSFWKMLLTKRVPENFKFKFCRNLLTGYCGIAKKQV
jgi:2-polyprenyl-6-hydroxyphenyl methylase/3-demethylubiquinone-9 3-methyltransferase